MLENDAGFAPAAADAPAAGELAADAPRLWTRPSASYAGALFKPGSISGFRTSELTSIEPIGLIL